MGTGRYALFAAVLLMMLACGRSATAPTLALLPGFYTITTSLDSEWCVETGQAPVPVLSLRSLPEQRDSDWVFRVWDQPESTFELWVHASSEGGATQQIHGMIRGSARISTVPAVTADFGKLGVIAGTTDLQQASGAITGQVKFADTLGNVLTCTKVRWSFVRTGNP